VTSFNAFFWFLQLTTAYTPERIFTKNMSKDVVLAKNVPFVGPDDRNQYFDPLISPKPPFWGLILTGLFCGRKSKKTRDAPI